MAEIDPTYAAQFQRGFDPEQHEAPRARRGPVRLTAGPAQTAERVPEPPRTPPSPEIAENVDADPSEAAPLEGEEPSSRTPLVWWDWLLPGIGVALIVVSLALWWGLATDIGASFGTGDTDRWTLFVHYARYELAGPLLMAGVVAVTAGLVLQAVRPRR
jgi:hypothetical protein